MFLFKVEQTFMITEMGLVLTPGLGDNHVKTGSRIKLIRPDKSTIEAVIRGIVFETRDISVGNELTKQDVPIGTEVWLIE